MSAGDNGVAQSALRIMPRILIATFGSFGDLHPYLALARELRRRGHSVTIATSATYQTKVEGHGLDFHPVRPDIDLDNRAMLEYVMNARHGSERVVRFLASLVRESYADTLAAAQSADAIVTHPITFAAVLAAQKLAAQNPRVRWISTVLAPLSMLSSYDPPISAQLPWLGPIQRLSPVISKSIWSLARRHTLPWVQPVIDLKNELGLPSGAHPLFEGQHSPSLVLALFSRTLAAPQPDWPPQTVVTGFPFYDHGELPFSVQTFLDDCARLRAAPVVFTLGSSAVSAAGNFYGESLAAVERAGCRALFLTGPHPQGLPETLPSGVLALPYAPHQTVFPHAAAIVHQGGIGTTAQALRAGRPMLVMPFGHDQFDNAARVKRLGAAEVLYRSQYKSMRVAKVLTELLTQNHYAQAAAQLGEKVRSENGAVAAADAIESEVGRR